MTKYELEYVKLSLELYYCTDYNKIAYKEEKLSKMYGYNKQKENIDNVVTYAKSFFDDILTKEKIYNIRKDDLYDIIESLNATELVNDNLIPVYNASTFFPYINNIQQNHAISYHFLPKNLVSDKYEYIGLQVTEFILETKTPKYKPLDIIVLRISEEFQNGTDVLVEYKGALYIKNLYIYNETFTLTNPSELNPSPQKYKLEDYPQFSKESECFKLRIVGTIIDVFDSGQMSYNYLTHNYYFPIPNLKNQKIPS